MYDALQQYLPSIVSAVVAVFVVCLVAALLLRNITDTDAKKWVRMGRNLILIFIAAGFGIMMFKAASVEAVPRSTIDRSAGDEAQQALEQRAN